MAARIKVPSVTNKNLVIRYTKNPSDVYAANKLVFRRYVDLGYWKNDEQELERNHYLNSSARHVFVAEENGKLLGTVSIILDSPDGLPADSFQGDAVNAHRSTGERIAEVSAFATESDHDYQFSLVNLLVAYLFQYSFYYAAVDRFIAVCTPKHARFYRSEYGFKRVSSTGLYNYVNVDAQMVTLKLADGYATSKQTCQNTKQSESFFRFMYRDAHPSMVFPSKHLMQRSRLLDWTAYDEPVSRAG